MFDRQSTHPKRRRIQSVRATLCQRKESLTAIRSRFLKLKDTIRSQSHFLACAQIHLRFVAEPSNTRNLLKLSKMLVARAQWKRMLYGRDGEYAIRVVNKSRSQKGVKKLVVDGKVIEGNRIPLSAGRHVVEVTL